MGFGDFLSRVGQGLNDYSEHARDYNEDSLLLQKYGRNWRQYAAAANARVQAEIDKPASDAIKEADAHNDSVSRRKMAEASHEELLQQHARARLDDATRMLTSQAVINPDGTVTVPDPSTLPKEMTDGLAADSLQRAVAVLTSGLSNDEARRRALAKEKVDQEAAKNRRELGESDAQFRDRLKLEAAENDRRHARDIADKPHGMTYVQAHAAVMAELSRNHKRATPDEVHAMVLQQMENGSPAPAAAPAAPADDSSVPAYLLREGMGRTTDFGSIGAGPLGAPAQQTRVVNGVTFVKTAGGWAKAK